MSWSRILGIWFITAPFLLIGCRLMDASFFQMFILGGLLGVGCCLLSLRPEPRQPMRPPIHDAEDTRDYNDLVVQQFRRIRQLQSALDEHKSAVDDVRKSMICIGGPLNDNKLGYTAEQRKPFHRIEQMIAGLGSEYDPRLDE